MQRTQLTSLVFALLGCVVCLFLNVGTSPSFVSSSGTQSSNTADGSQRESGTGRTAVGFPGNRRLFCIPHSLEQSYYFALLTATDMYEVVY
jgi:hypothetical protein